MSDPIKAITDERGAVYGHPWDNFKALGDAVEALEIDTRHPDPVVRRLHQAAYMVVAKLSRLIRTPDHLDSWDDIAGYARTARMCIERRDEEAEAQQ